MWSRFSRPAKLGNSRTTSGAARTSCSAMSWAFMSAGAVSSPRIMFGIGDIASNALQWTSGGNPEHQARMRVVSVIERSLMPSGRRLKETCARKAGRETCLRPRFETCHGQGHAFRLLITEAFPSLRSAAKTNSQIWGQKSQHRLYSMVAPLAHQQRVVTWRLVRFKKEDALRKGQRHLITINSINDTISNSSICDSITPFNYVIHGRGHNCFSYRGITVFWTEASLHSTCLHYLVLIACQIT